MTLSFFLSHPLTLVVTPGKELPGGWGSTKVEHPSTTIYEDVQTALHGIGKQGEQAVMTSFGFPLSPHLMPLPGV